MKVILDRNESKYNYLSGKLYGNDYYLCDTMEFNSLLVLQPGVYKLSIQREPYTNGKMIYVQDQKNAYVSKFVKDNKEYPKGSPIRVKNSLIEIGFNDGKNNLIMFSKINQILISDLENDYQKGIESTLTVLNLISDDLNIEMVSNY
jgi:hypothetical protein